MRDAALRMKGWYDSFGDALSAGALAFRTEMPSGGKNRYDLEIYNPVGQAEETFFCKIIIVCRQRCEVAVSVAFRR